MTRDTLTSYGFGRSAARAVAVLAACVLAALAPGVAKAAQARPPASGGTAVPAVSYTTITGSGSSWSYPAIKTWISDVSAYSMTVNYNPDGSGSGRQEFRNGIDDFAASEIPYGLVDGQTVDNPPTRKYSYMPDTAGGTAFMYNLHLGNAQITNLRLSGAAIAGIFTGTITRWNDPVIKADNPGTALPNELITPVVRSDSSGSTSQFTQWMIGTQGSAWPNYCQKVSFTPCTQTSIYPLLNGSQMVGQPRDGGVAAYVANSKAEGTIGYVEYSYAFQYHMPVAKVLNAAGYYTLPTYGNVAVSLLHASLNTNPSDVLYLTQDLHPVWSDTDPRVYELSSYSYMILPEDLCGCAQFNTAKGYTLAQFGKFLLCQGQTQVDNIGYSAVPYNLVFDGYNELAKMPGSTLQVPASAELLAEQCKNPTFAPGHVNLLADTDPQPPACDKQGATPCGTSSTPGSGGGGSGNGSGGSGNGSGGSGTGGTGTGGTGTGGTGTHGSTGTGSGGSSGTGGSTGTGTGSGTGAGGSGGSATCDPNTGVCSSAGTGLTGTGGNNVAGAATVNGVSVGSPTSMGDGVQMALMVLAAAMLLCLGLVPPLLAQVGQRRRQRRMDSYFTYTDQDGNR